MPTNPLPLPTYKDRGYDMFLRKPLRYQDTFGLPQSWSDATELSQSSGVFNQNAYKDAYTANVHSNGVAKFSIDIGDQYRFPVVSLADNASYTPAGGTVNFSGLMIVTDVYYGYTASFVVGNGIALLGQTNTTFTVTANNPGTTNVYYSGGVVYIQNKQGVTAWYKVLMFRTRDFG